MMAVAKRRGQEIDRWSGPIDWLVEMPAALTVKRHGRRWVWSRSDTNSLRIRAKNRKPGRGQMLTKWADEQKADHVSVIVVDYPGKPVDGAGMGGLGVSGQGHGWSRNRTQPAHTARVRGPDTQGSDTLDIGEGDPGTGLALDTSMTGQGQGTGTGQGAIQGRGSSDIGTRTGSTHGSETPSWHYNPRSDVARHGGRTPADHGKGGGSASGQVGATGHANGAGWLNIIDLPVQLSGAAAIVVIA